MAEWGRGDRVCRSGNDMIRTAEARVRSAQSLRVFSSQNRVVIAWVTQRVKEKQVVMGRG